MPTYTVIAVLRAEALSWPNGKEVTWRVGLQDSAGRAHTLYVAQPAAREGPYVAGARITLDERLVSAEP
jgi:hypothetical protein